MKILAIIPARCGSKGIPFKNIIDVNGKPLIQYTIDIALQLKFNNLINEVIVSTDCNEIESVSKELGVDVPFLRPDNISGDKAKSIDYVLSSTKNNLNTWVTVKANVKEDFMKLHGIEVSDISGIAIMTDTDNSKLKAISYYQSIYFSSK